MNVQRTDSSDPYDVRSVHPDVYLGTASDRYAGWIGTIYSESWRESVTHRSRKLGGRSFREEQVPIASAAEYFEHFRCLELDFTFYRPLIDPDGTPGNNYRVLSAYAEAAPGHARFYLKAPQQVFARRLRGGRTSSYRDNPDYLNVGMFVKGFLDPARDLLGDRLGGVICEQEYQRQRDSPTAESHTSAFATFFSEVQEATGRHAGRDLGCHLEIRSPHLLESPYFDWLEAAGIGHVFSHWTWLPPIRDQWMRSGQRLTSARQEVVSRLLTPLRVPYAEAYAAAFPFDRELKEIAESESGKAMVLDTVALSLQALRHDTAPVLLLNNRAWGSAPELARRIAERLRAEIQVLSDGLTILRPTTLPDTSH